MPRRPTHADPTTSPTVPATLVEALRARAHASPTKRAFTFLRDGEVEAEALTYAELDRRARAVASHLQGEGIEDGERVLLMFPPGLSYISALFGCMYCKALAVPCPMPDPARPEPTRIHVQSVTRKVGATRALTLERSDDFEHAVALEGIEWTDMDGVDDGAAGNWRAPELESTTLAYLQHTSGSTSTPRGVVISHRNLVHQLVDFNRGYDHGPDSVMVSWLPTFHDLGLVYGVLLPVFFGFHCVHLSPQAFIRRPIRWMRALDRYRGTHTAAPNFAYDLVVRKTNRDERAGLDLSCVEIALNGAEPIARETIVRFLETYGPLGLRDTAASHAYGLAEATAKVSSAHRATTPRWLALDREAMQRNEVVVSADAETGRWVAGCGVTTGDTQVAIVDPDARRALGEDRIGEIWVSGTTVSQGYWNDPEATAAAFGARLADSDRLHLRTGNLGFVHDGHLYVVGRRKDVIIVRGLNHHPQDIERGVTRSHPALRPGCAIAFALDDPGNERIVVVAEVNPARTTDPEAVLRAVRSAVAAQGLAINAILLVPPRAVPKTSSGKSKRTRAKEMYVDGRFEAVATYTRAPTE